MVDGKKNMAPKIIIIIIIIIIFKNDQQSYLEVSPIFAWHLLKERLETIPITSTLS